MFVQHQIKTTSFDITTADLENLSLEELKSLDSELVEDTTSINLQLEFFQLKKMEGEEVTADMLNWQKRAIIAKKVKGYQKQIVQREFAKRNEEVQRKNQHLASAFMHAAYENLPHELFEKIRDIAIKEVSQHG